MSKVNNKEKA